MEDNFQNLFFADVNGILDVIKGHKLFLLVYIYRSYSGIRRTVFFMKNLSLGGKLVLKLGCVL